MSLPLEDAATQIELEHLLFKSSMVLHTLLTSVATAVLGVFNYTHLQNIQLVNVPGGNDMGGSAVIP